MSPSTRLPSTEHRVAAASSLRAAAMPPLVQAAFLGMYVTGGHAAALTRALQLCRPFGVSHRYMRPSSPSPRTDVPGYHMPPSLARVATSTHGLRHTFRFFFTYFEHRRNVARPLLADACPAKYFYDSLGVQPDPPGHRWVCRLLRLCPSQLRRQRHRLILDYTFSSTLTTADCIDTSLFPALRLATVQEPSSASLSDMAQGS
jgi:hypothetical protein